MSEREPITAELRGKMDTLGWYDEDGNIVFTTGGTPVSEIACLAINSKTFGELCDAIDAVHAQLEHDYKVACEVNERQDELYADMVHKPDRAYEKNCNQRRQLTENGFMRLPRSIEDKPINEHDKVDWRDHAGTWHENATVVAVCNDGCYVMDCIVFHVHKSDIRHHHAQTVEDVLREFGKAWVEWEDGSPYDPIAKYAVKLRLAGGDAE